MAEPRLIRGYRAALLAGLPALLAEEVSDGLAEAYADHLRQGLVSDDAAAAAVAEFGDPAAVIAAFCRASTASRLARGLIATGPVIGACWAAALMTGHAWNWPIPAIGPAIVAALLSASIVTLLTAARSRRYRPARRSGTAGCIGIAILDVTMITAAIALAPVATWLVAIAICASTARLLCMARLVVPALR
jgi:hypothetical protein